MQRQYVGIKQWILEGAVEGCVAGESRQMGSIVLCALDRKLFGLYASDQDPTNRTSCNLRGVGVGAVDTGCFSQHCSLL